MSLDIWQLISLAVTLLLAFFGFAAGTWQIVNRLQRADVMEAKTKAQEVEKDLLRLKADLPLDYVRRDDWIRNQSVIEAKLDGLATKLEALREGR